LSSVRFIRYAKITVLIADIWTLAYAALLVGWQTLIFVKDGTWQNFPLSFVFSTPKNADSEIHSTASIGVISKSQAANFADGLLQMPIITLLLLGAAFLTAFYLWLHKIDSQPRVH
jgi:hypothetical protein